MKKPYTITDTLDHPIMELQSESLLDAEYEAASLLAPEDLENPEDLLDWAEENLRILAGK